MCCSFWPARFTQTITGTWEVQVDGKLNHVLWYQNRVGNGSRSGGGAFLLEAIVQQALQQQNWREICAGPMQVNNISERDVIIRLNQHLEAAGRDPWPVPELPQVILHARDANALVIPILGKWDSIKLLNTLENKSFLEDISSAVQPQPRPVAATWGVGSVYGGGGGGVVFLQFDIYDIVLAQNANDVIGALSQIQPAKRPSINREVFDTLAAWYDCPVALCCFNNAESGVSKPLAFAFEPLFPEKLCVYTLDAHDGRAPAAELVELNHAIFVGSYLTPSTAGTAVNYTEEIPYHLRPYVLDRVMGMHVNNTLKNGDFVFDVSEVRAGKFAGLRVMPPKAGAMPTAPLLITRDEPYVVTSGS